MIYCRKSTAHAVEATVLRSVLDDDHYGGDVDAYEVTLDEIPYFPALFDKPSEAGSQECEEPAGTQVIIATEELGTAPLENQDLVQTPEPQLPFVVFQFGHNRITLPIYGASKGALAFKIWRASLLAAARLARQPTLLDSSGEWAHQQASLSAELLYKCCQGKEVLELGCGCALAGLLAGQLGAARVVLTDCKDDALVQLRSRVERPHMTRTCEEDSGSSPGSSCIYEVLHLLWQQDRVALDHAGGCAPLGDWGDNTDRLLDSCADLSLDSSFLEPPLNSMRDPSLDPSLESIPALSPAMDLNRDPALWSVARSREVAGLLSGAESFAEVRHWSDACREPSIPALSPCRQFDLILASDCLYFSDQEDSLLASVLLRMRRPHGAALIVFQPRNNNGSCIIRLAAAMRAAGLHVLHEKGPWCLDRMTADHLRHVPGMNGQSQMHMSLHRIAGDEADMELLTVAWRPFTKGTC